MVGMDLKQRSHQRNSLKPKEQEALIRAVNPCFGTWHCILFRMRDKVSYPNPAECPVGAECFVKFAQRYAQEDFGIEPGDYKPLPKVRREILRHIRRTYLGESRPKGKTPASKVRGKSK